MNKAVKYTLIGVAGVFALIMAIGIIGAIAGVGQDTKPEAVRTVDTGPSPEPVITPTNKPKPKVTPTKAPVPKKTTSSKVTPTAKKTLTYKEREDLFLIVMRNEYPVLDSADDKVILDAGHSVCSMWYDHYTFKQIAAVEINAGIEPRTAGFLIGAATQAFCPSQVNKMK